MKNELRHWELKEKHKYIAKIEKGKKTRYFYSKQEWLAYLKGNKSLDDKNDVIKKSIAVSSKKTNAISPERSTTIFNTTKHIEKGKKYFNEKANESLGFILALPTEVVKDAWNFVKDIFDKDKNDTKKNDQPPQTQPSTTVTLYPNPQTVIPSSNEDIYEEKEIPEWAEGLKPMTEEMTHDENQEVINPNYNPYYDAYSQNCAYCSAAYDLRERGYDVEAMPYDPETYNANVHEISSWYKNTSAQDWEINAYGYGEDPLIDNNVTERQHLWSKTETALDAMPDNSHGQFNVFWEAGGGHSMVWEKENGTTTIRDCQSNVTYSYKEFVNEYSHYIDATMVLRTDNREPSDKIKKTVRNRE